MLLEIVIAAIRKALRSDGTWMIADIHGQPSFEQNLTDNQLVAQNKKGELLRMTRIREKNTTIPRRAL